MTHLDLSFFNRFQATLDDQPVVNFRSVKIQGLLIFLALTSKQAHAREKLAALFWPDEPDGVAKKNLRQSLYRLRQLLGEDDAQGGPFLLISYSTVQLNPASDYRLDVADFLVALEKGELETAVSLYHGDLLPSFSCDSPPLDDWLRQERERHHRLALDALFKLAAQNLAQADYQAAQSLARRQFTLEPWREEAHQQLIQALALHGDRSGAIAQYETCRALLAEELGVEPAWETKQLIARIREQRLTNTAISPSGASHPQRLTIPFVGRKTEFAVLVELYRQTAVQGVQLVTLVGSAGIGKTRLAQEFLLWAATQGADVLRGRAYETSADLSYQPIIQLFRQRLERENAPEDLLSDLWLAQLTRLWPELRERYPDLPEPLQEENIARQHLYEAVARLGQALARRTPLVMFIDDGQWADTASLDLLQHAMGCWAEEKTPILLLVTLRQEALVESPDTQRWLTHLKRHVPSRQLNLSELSEPETTHLLERLLAAQPSEVSRFRNWLFAETAGQPLFLTETLKALVDEGVVTHAASSAAGWQVDWAKLQEQATTMHIWPGVREIVRGWLQRLTDSASQLLAATAVLVEEASFNHLYRVAGLDESEAITALDELLARQILLEADSGLLSLHHDPIYQFSHQKISDVVYAEAGAARRRILHRRAFAALQASGASAAALAHHALNAGLVTETIYHSLLAGDEARALFATQVAIAHYKTAFQVGEQKGWPEAISGADRQALYTGLGRAYELSEQAEAAEELYEAMVAYARQVGAPAMECQGLNHLAELYSLVLFNPDKAFDVLGQAWRVAERTGDRRGMAETAQNLSFAAKNIHDTDNELKYAEQALALARELEHPALLARCLRRLAYATIGLRDWEKVEQVAAEAQQRFEEMGNLFLANNIQQIVGGCQTKIGRLQESLATHKKAYAFIQQVENAWEQAHAACFLAMAHAELGQYGQAIQLVRESVALVRKANHPLVTIPLSAYGMIHRAVLCLDEAQEAWLEIKKAADGEGFYPFPDQTLAELCAIHALRGEWAQAHTYAKEIVAFHTGKSLLPMATTGWLETEALLRGGDAALARSEVERFAAIVGSNRRYQLPLLRSQAVLAQWDGDVAQAVSHLQAALTLGQEMELPGEAWPILGELGSLYAEQGEEVKARQAYEEAGTIIRRLAETIDEEMLRRGFLAAKPVRTVLETSEAMLALN
ncbi:MAG: BTAD domain-containing putative transcriptional regulator [Chloroflexota bacterium]